ncbi:MAG: polysaccharide biosynthesis/export family protein [Chloroflexota bacterium]|nr:polysaccharide biosynthesis/export family protein [Chloroflexota bacterium]
MCAAPAVAQSTVVDSVRAAAVPPVTDADEGSYLLNPGDTIDIKFISNPELNELVQIRPDGRISMPLVGELLVARATIAELSTRLTTAYTGILRSPSATIQVREFANRRVFVGGEVNRPGMLAMVGRQTALGAVMEAGGFKPSAARDEVLVIRRGDQDAPRLLRLSMQHSAGQAAEAANFNLQPLDIVLVTESGVARTGRAVDQYVRQMIPVSLTGGFSWLLGRGVLGGTK